ncbi:hypothetical protein ACJMK2_005593 [Sinanodonta woodiana]|uniref:Nanos-type domain-containing protein n=1 Tax=Sinanodonta woodiana TaxID=1069815 RepID=A0ABD3VR03_SINWO
MDSYKPFQDYFGLTTLVWANDLRTHMEEIMALPWQEKYSNDLGISVDNFSAFDPLELMRLDARDDFQSNGIDADLDELDMYQQQLREQTTVEKLIVESTDNPVLMEYLALKEKRRVRKQKKCCAFCKNNGEPASVYQSHVLKDDEGRVACPILRKYTCPFCGVSGDNAHTIRYCPKNEGDAPGLSLLKTSRLSTGKRRSISK